MNTCSKCGAEIIWITTLKGKKMPCNATPINLICRPGGEITAMTKDGYLVHGDISHAGGGTLCYQVHWATCPEARHYRGRG